MELKGRWWDKIRWCPESRGVNKVLRVMIWPPGSLFSYSLIIQRFLMLCTSGFASLVYKVRILQKHCESNGKGKWALSLNNHYICNQWAIKYALYTFLKTKLGQNLKMRLKWALCVCFVCLRVQLPISPYRGHACLHFSLQKPYQPLINHQIRGCIF